MVVSAASSDVDVVALACDRVELLLAEDANACDRTMPSEATAASQKHFCETEQTCEACNASAQTDLHQGYSLGSHDLSPHKRPMASFFTAQHGNQAHRLECFPILGNALLEGLALGTPAASAELSEKGRVPKRCTLHELQRLAATAPPPPHWSHGG